MHACISLRTNIHNYLHVCDPGLTLPAVTVTVWRGGGGRQIIGRDASCVPVCPVYAVRLEVQVHGIDAHVGIALEDLLIAPVWHGGVQAADLTVVGDVEHLSRS